jgi:hypothetical protein
MNPACTVLVISAKLFLRVPRRTGLIVVGKDTSSR